MKRLLVIALALAPTPAAARIDFMCGIDLRGGDRVIYYFEKISDDALVEIGVIKNGKVTNHLPDARPLWIARYSNGYMSLHWAKNWKWGIVFKSDAKRIPTTNFAGSKASMYGDDVKMGEGVCGIELKPKGPTPIPED